MRNSIGSDEQDQDQEPGMLKAYRDSNIYQKLKVQLYVGRVKQPDHVGGPVLSLLNMIGENRYSITECGFHSASEFNTALQAYDAAMMPLEELLHSLYLLSLYQGETGSPPREENSQPSGDKVGFQDQLQKLGEKGYSKCDKEDREACVSALSQLLTGWLDSSTETVCFDHFQSDLLPFLQLTQYKHRPVDGGGIAVNDMIPYLFNWVRKAVDCHRDELVKTGAIHHHWTPDSTRVSYDSQIRISKVSSAPPLVSGAHKADHMLLRYWGDVTLDALENGRDQEPGHMDEQILPSVFNLKNKRKRKAPGDLNRSLLKSVVKIAAAYGLYYAYLKPQSSLDQAEEGKWGLGFVVSVTALMLIQNMMERWATYASLSYVDQEEYESLERQLVDAIGLTDQPGVSGLQERVSGLVDNDQNETPGIKKKCFDAAQRVASVITRCIALIDVTLLNDAQKVKLAYQHHGTYYEQRKGEALILLEQMDGREERFNRTKTVIQEEGAVTFDGRRSVNPIKPFLDVVEHVFDGTLGLYRRHPVFNGMSAVVSGIGMACYMADYKPVPVSALTEVIRVLGETFVGSGTAEIGFSGALNLWTLGVLWCNFRSVFCYFYDNSSAMADAYLGLTALNALAHFALPYVPLIGSEVESATQGATLPGSTNIVALGKVLLAGSLFFESKRGKGSTVENLSYLSILLATSLWKPAACFGLGYKGAASMGSGIFARFATGAVLALVVAYSKIDLIRSCATVMLRNITVTLMDINNLVSRFLSNLSDASTATVDGVSYQVSRCLSYVEGSNCSPRQALCLFKSEADEIDATDSNQAPLLEGSDLS